MFLYTKGTQVRGELTWEGRCVPVINVFSECPLRPTAKRRVPALVSHYRDNYSKTEVRQNGEILSVEIDARPKI